jgi:hypothetical protein
MERLDGQWGHSRATPMPVVEEFALMLGRPLQDHVANAAGRIALDNCQRRDAYDQFALPINGMEMSGEWADENHADDNAIEF